MAVCHKRLTLPSLNYLQIMEQEQPIETEELDQPEKKSHLFIFSNSFPNFLLHLALIVVIGIGGIIFTFNIYLPSVTNHNETITVPLLTEMKMEDAEKLLEQKDLRYEIIDSSYQMNMDAGIIIDQTPPMNSKVKLNRKIYLTVSASIPPKIDIPDIIDSSVKNAQLLLKSHELKVGTVKYVDDLATNAVLKVLFNEKEYTKEELREGITVDKGSSIDLIVGNGLGKTSMEVPNVIGMDYEEAQTLLRGVGLSIGTIEFVKSGSSLGVVTTQLPKAGDKIQIGEIIELWVSEIKVDSAVQDSSGVQ